MDKPTLQHIIDSLKTQLAENEGELGYWGEKIEFLPLKGEHTPPPGGGRLGGGELTKVKSPSHPPPPSPDGHRRASLTPPFGGGNKAADLEILRTDTIGDCHVCPLGDTRIKLVFGVGNPEAQVMFIGEGPGYDEDRQGEPFVGKAGQLLDRILAAIGLDRTKVYIANIVKCHPLRDPNNPEQRGNDRPPSDMEAAACLPFLMEQIRIISPKVIVTLGAPATKTLLQTTDGITRLRGQWKKVSLFPDQDPIPVLPTYHPAALLRDESLKRLVWDDMKQLREFLSA